MYMQMQKMETGARNQRNSRVSALPNPIPTLPASTAAKDGFASLDEQPPKKFVDYFYNRETKEYCGRTCQSWIYIIGYGFIYLTFLVTYTLIVLYLSLSVLKSVTVFEERDIERLTYPEKGVGLTATPTSESNYPLIWYKRGEKRDYDKYIRAIDKLLLSNRYKKAIDHLGPCGQSPYGYGERPCVIIRINKYFHWSGKPLQLNSSVAQIVPPEVKRWIMSNNKLLWLQCSGYHSYDKEHIGSIKYYPDPPGVHPGLFPLKKEDVSPLVAIQISDFTVGVSLAIECNLWYEAGPSTVNFVLYVAPQGPEVLSGQTNLKI